jgi:hypothetical protein
MKKILIPLYVSAILLFSGCEEFFESTGDSELTKERVVEGLKKALEIGTDSASTSLHALNGYYRDEAVKILLPEEAQVVYTTQQKLDPYLNQLGFSLDDQIEKVVKSINRAAESAASEAKPLFVDAITDLTVEEAWNILEGRVPESDSTKSTAVYYAEDYDSTAATKYFKSATYNGLVGVFSEPIDDALDEDLGLGFSANDAWSTLTTNYNQAVNLYNNSVGLIGESLEPINVSIGEHCTQKALDGLFLKVGNEEKKIRKDPFQWAEEVIQEVFGWVQEQFA